MAEFDDDQMKEIFGRLHDYDSPSAGISWGSVAKRLPVTGLKLGGKAFLALLIPASVIIWLSVDDPAILADAVDSATQSGSTLSPQSPPAQEPRAQNVPVPVGPSQVANVPLTAGQKSRQAIQKHQVAVLVESSSVSDDGSRVAEPPAIEPWSGVPATTVVDTPSVSVVAINATDSTAMTVAPDRNNVRRPGFSLEALYLFGVVDPLKGDNRIVQDYISKPGFGFSGSVSVPLRLRQGSSLYFVPSVHVFYKPYDFVVVEYEDEYISMQHKVGESLAAYVGAGVIWNVRTWQAGAAFHAGAGKEDILFARTLLSLSLKKDLVPVVKDRLLLTVGGSFMLPVSGSGEYLRYTPITVGIGIRKR